MYDTFWCIFHNIPHIITNKLSQCWRKSHPWLLTLTVTSDVLAMKICSHAHGRLCCEMACSFKSRCQADVLFVVCYDTLHVNCNLNLDFPAEEHSGCDWCRHVSRSISIPCVFYIKKKMLDGLASMGWNLAIQFCYWLRWMLMILWKYLSFNKNRHLSISTPTATALWATVVVINDLSVASASAQLVPRVAHGQLIH